MFRIDNPTAASALPAIPAVGVAGYFTKGNPGTGTSATIVNDWWLNTVQEEILTVIVNAGLTPDKNDHTQLYQALLDLIGTHTRRVLVAPTTLYVATTGNDSNNGLTAATPLATGQAAWNKAVTYDLNGFGLTIQFADGTYTNPINCSGNVQGIVTQGGVALLGNVATPANVHFNMASASCVSVQRGASITIAGVTLSATGVATDYVSMGQGLVVGSGQIVLGAGIVFGACQTGHMACYGGSIGSSGQPYAITGGGSYHVAALSGGTTTITNSAVTITGTPAFANFCYATSGSLVDARGCAFAGAATGQRYYGDMNSIIDTASGGANYFPGNAAGILASGAQYI